MQAAGRQGNWANRVYDERKAVSVDPSNHRTWEGHSCFRITVTFPAASNSLKERMGSRTQSWDPKTQAALGRCIGSPSAAKAEPLCQGQMNPGSSQVQAAKSVQFM